ncbi:MAG: hypothetical protein IJD04_02755 [Desulfovibrionaceae bacterium]|nr:hypothetical protein [Desulfovibrionaceae bacterium]
MKKLAVIFSLLFLLSYAGAAQAESVKYSASINGYDWNATPAAEKLAFVEGINYAIAIDYEIDQWRKKNNKASILSAFDQGWIKRFSGHTTSQIVQEINDFYSGNPDKLNQSLGRVIWYELIGAGQFKE